MENEFTKFGADPATAWYGNKVKDTFHRISSGGRPPAPYLDTAVLRRFLPKVSLRKSGFTVVEVIIAAAIMTMITAAALGIFIAARTSWTRTSLGMAASREASMAISRIIYGAGAAEGLRSAKGMEINNNYVGHFSGATYPPGAGENSHYLTSGYPDGSWRLTITNYDESVTWLDYNSKASNIVFWPVTGSGNETARQLIGNYVSLAKLTRDGNRNLRITVNVTRKQGRYAASNEISSLVTFRNLRLP